MFTKFSISLYRGSLNRFWSLRTLRAQIIYVLNFIWIILTEFFCIAGILFNRTFPWRNCSIKTNGKLIQMKRRRNTNLLFWVYSEDYLLTKALEAPQSKKCFKLMQSSWRLTPNEVSKHLAPGIWVEKNSKCF